MVIIKWVGQTRVSFEFDGFLAGFPLVTLLGITFVLEGRSFELSNEELGQISGALRFDLPQSFYSLLLLVNPSKTINISTSNKSGSIPVIRVIGKRFRVNSCNNPTLT